MSSTYAPKGETPVINCESKNKLYVSVSGVISPCGFSYFESRPLEGFKQKGLIRFLDNAWTAASKALTVVWDNASSHHAKTIKAYLAKQSKKHPRIRVENTPPYSPELNPIEQVWSYLKYQLRNHFAQNVTELRQIVTNELDKITKNKKLIISFFKNKQLKCYQFFD